MVISHIGRKKVIMMLKNGDKEENSRQTKGIVPTVAFSMKNILSIRLKSRLLLIRKDYEKKVS